MANELDNNVLENKARFTEADAKVRRERFQRTGSFSRHGRIDEFNERPFGL